MRRRYDQTAHMYDERYAEEQEAKYRAALQGLSVGAGSRVLDIGCGTGLFFSHVADEAEAVVGVDFSHQLLLQARDRTRQWRNVFLVRADADRLPFKDDFFDFVFVFTVLQNMPEPLETLKEAARTAAQGASVVVTGLKKSFASEAFAEMLQRAELVVVSLRDDETLKCYVAVGFKRRK